MDWAPGYREFPAPHALRRQIHCLWLQVVPSTRSVPKTVLPDACTDLIWQSGVGAMVAGPDTEPYAAALQPGAVLVGARFHPGAGGAAFGLPLSELLNERVDSTDLRALRGWRLPGSLSPETAMERVARIAATLAVDRPADELVLRAVDRLERAGDQAELIAGQLEVSERQLRRRCQAAAGYGPRTLHRVLKFRRFVAIVDADGPVTDLADAAARAGYADQAHLSRESRRLAGLPPGALARTRAATD